MELLLPEIPSQSLYCECSWRTFRPERDLRTHRTQTRTGQAQARQLQRLGQNRLQSVLTGTCLRIARSCCHLGRRASPGQWSSPQWARSVAPGAPPAARAAPPLQRAEYSGLGRGKKSLLCSHTQNKPDAARRGGSRRADTTRHYSGAPLQVTSTSPCSSSCRRPSLSAGGPAASP